MAGSGSVENATLAADHAHCLAVLRETDRDRYLACLLTPADKRGPLSALYAFNAEIARIRDLVHEPLPGEIRMQWWRDLLEGGADGDASANPLARALLRTVADHRLPVSSLVALIEARIFDLYDDPMESRTAFEGYAGETASALIQMASLILDAEKAAGSATIAGHTGVAQTVAGSLLLLEVHRRRGQVYLPADLLAATGLDAREFLLGTNRPAVANAITAFVGFGRDHLRQARSAGTIAPGNIFAFLPVAFIERVFNAAERAGADALEKSLQPPQWRRQWAMWRMLATRRL